MSQHHYVEKVYFSLLLNATVKLTGLIRCLYVILTSLHL